jgi:hypothetical protein
MTDESCTKALIAFAGAVAEAGGEQMSNAIASLLAEFADGPACDPATSELLWHLVEVVQWPALTPRGMLGQAFA